MREKKSCRNARGEAGLYTCKRCFGSVLTSAGEVEFYKALHEAANAANRRN